MCVTLQIVNEIHRIGARGSSHYTSGMGGRKPKPEHRRRSQRTTFVSLKAERERFDAAAAAADMDLSEWIREALIAECDRLGIPIPQAVPQAPVPQPKKPRTRRKTAQ